MNYKTPDEVMRIGIDMTRQLHHQLLESQNYYLGRRTTPPPVFLSEVYRPSTGPIYAYFVLVARTITRAGLRGALFNRSILEEFRQVSTDELKDLRRFVAAVAPFLDPSTAERKKRIHGRALKVSVELFRRANERFFNYMRHHRILTYILLRNHVNEAMGLYLADRMLNDISKAFEVRERQLRGESPTPEHSFYSLEIAKQQNEQILHLIENQGRGISSRLKAIEKVSEAMSRWFDPQDAFAGVGDAKSFAKESQLRAAITYSWKHDFALSRNGRGKHTFADLARILWNANPNWCVSPDGYASCKAYENALREQARRNPKSFRWE